jgi:hypothetical protein
MPTFIFDKKELEKLNKRVGKELPSWEKRKKLFVPSIDIISTVFPHKSNIPIASVCLDDAIHTLNEACYALKEAFNCQIIYEERHKPPREINSKWFRQFYYIDIAFRLYSAGEDLAEAIICILEINETDLKEYLKKYSSRQCIVGNYLKNEKPDHKITEILRKLAKSEDWQKTRNYRNECVHDQPPSIEGLGIVHSRNIKWKFSSNGKAAKLTIGSKGDNPKYTIDEILNFVKSALFSYTETLTDVVNFYNKMLEEKGLKIDKEKRSVSWEVL